MHYLDLFEEILNEYTGTLSVRAAFRSWYNPNTEEFILVMDNLKKHADVVKRFPEKLGINPEDVADITSDFDLIGLACKKGWIRVAAQSLQDPKIFMAFEGNSLREIRKLATRFYDQYSSHQPAGIQNLAIELRNESGEQTSYVMYGPKTMPDNQQVVDFIEKGRLPKPMKKINGLYV